MNFVAIDVETANADMASICQIGLVKYVNGVLSDEWKTYINPEDYFDEINVSIHGIDESDVSGAPTFSKVIGTLHTYLDDTVVVCHTPFDHIAIQQAARRYYVPELRSRWLDSARVVRRTWKEYAWKGYGLYSVCKGLGYDFKQHDALEDAKAAAYVLIAAVKQSGIGIDGWFDRVRQPIDPTRSSFGSAVKREGNAEGPLHGEAIVFTGKLEMSRSKVADLAASIGCQVELGVTKKTTILVVGDQDIRKLAGEEKSSKHRKAEGLIKKGFTIKIIKESDFKELVEQSK